MTSGGEREAYLLYTNQMKDAIGCYDYGARVYCPKWYHFTSGDLVLSNLYDSQQLNRYSYTRNNPFKYTDPSGNFIALFGFWESNDLPSDVEYNGQEIQESVPIAEYHQAATEYMSSEEFINNLAEGIAIEYGLRFLKTPFLTKQKQVPNPYGKKGGPEHQAEVERVGKDIEKRNLEIVEEYPIYDKEGKKIVRYVDVAGLENEKAMELHQVGKQIKSEVPISRERQAIEEIESLTGKKVKFHAYNTDTNSNSVTGSGSGSTSSGSCSGCGSISTSSSWKKKGGKK